MKPHHRLHITLALLALLAAPAPSRAGLLDTIHKVSEGINQAKQGVQKADQIHKDAKQIVQSAKGFPLDQEIALGDAVSMQIVNNGGGIWQDEEATRRVNTVGKALARYCDRQELTWVFGILNTDTINAFSAPGGRVFITRGLYNLTLGDDTKLAGILAHEITHIVRKHALNSLRRGQALSASVDLSGAVSAAAGGSTNATYAQYAAYTAAYTADVQNIMGTLFDNGFDPSTEYGADQGALALCKATGIDPGGLRAALEAVSNSPKPEGWKPSDVFGTHPPLASRIALLPKKKN